MNISVVIPVRNGASTLGRCLECLRNQTVPPLEIIITDTSSTDNSKEIAMKYGAMVIDVPVASFDHGLTRNLGVQYASGELVYLTVQDAWIAENDMLERMSRHFDDAEVMAVTGHQAVPHEKDKNPARWYRRYSHHTVDVRHIEDAKKFLALPQSEQKKLVAWDNVVAMYRRSALEELPFSQTEMAEDWVWSYQALMNGWKLLRDSSLVVYHYHHQKPQYVFRTGYSVNYHFYKFFDYKPMLPGVIVPGMKAAYHLFQNKELSLREKFFWTFHNWFAGISAWACHVNFLLRLRFGGMKGIEKGYRKYCKEIPQGKQNASPA